MTTFDRAVEAARDAQKYHAICGGLGGNVYAAVTTGTRLEFVARFEDATIAFNQADRLTKRAAILAALKQLREPSAAMIDAGCLAQQDPTKFVEQAEHHMTDGDFARATWVAMLDAILKEGEGK